MPIIREFVCLAHGDFDAADPVCPHGCTGAAMIVRVHRTPPAIQTQGYRNINRTAQNLAADFGLSNIDQRGGDGGRRTTPETARRTSRELAMLGHGTLSDTDMNQFFQPVTAMGGKAGFGGSPIAKTETRTYTDARGKTYTVGDGKTVLPDFGGLTLGKPKAKLDAPAFDGTKLGLPAGDA